MAAPSIPQINIPSGGASDVLVNFANQLPSWVNAYVQSGRYADYQKERNRVEMARTEVLNEFVRLQAPFNDAWSTGNVGTMLHTYKRLDDLLKADGGAVAQIVMSDERTKNMWNDIRSKGLQPLSVPYTDGKVLHIQGGLNQLLATFGTTAFASRDNIIYNTALPMDKQELLANFKPFAETFPARKKNAIDMTLDPMQSGLDLTMQASRLKMEDEAKAKMYGIYAAGAAYAEGQGLKPGTQEFADEQRAYAMAQAYGSAAAAKMAAMKDYKKRVGEMTEMGLAPYLGKDGNSLHDTTLNVSKLMTEGGGVNKAISDKIYKLTDNTFDTMTPAEQAGTAAVAAGSSFYLQGTNHKKVVYSRDKDGSIMPDSGKTYQTGEYFPNPAEAMTRADEAAQNSSIPAIIRDLPEDQRFEILDQWNATTGSSASSALQKRAILYLRAMAMTRDNDLEDTRTYTLIAADVTDEIEKKLKDGPVDKDTYNNAYTTVLDALRNAKAANARLYESTSTDPRFEMTYNVVANKAKSVIREAHDSIPVSPGTGHFRDASRYQWLNYYSRSSRAYPSGPKTEPTARDMRRDAEGRGYRRWYPVEYLESSTSQPTHIKPPAFYGI